MGKVKIKAHDPPNLIPGIDIRCFAQKTTYFWPKKSRSTDILLFGFLRENWQKKATGRKCSSGILSNFLNF